MRVHKRIPFYTNPAHTTLPKIPNPLPKTAGKPVHVRGGCFFYDLTANASEPPKDKSTLPPLLPNRVGKNVSEEDLEKMKDLRKQKWTITALSNKFKITRSFIINKVLSEKEQKMAQEELVERIDSLSLRQKRGWLMKHKIREHRRDLW